MVMACYLLLAMFELDNVFLLGVEYVPRVTLHLQDTNKRRERETEQKDRVRKRE